MVATAYLPPPPAIPVTALPREQVRSLAHIYGHHRRHANYRFCALLPVVVRDRIHVDDGCRDPYEWAARFGGMTRPEVDRILRLWSQIGKFDCLWRLLGEGVGISKLERVAPHATEENAEWLAEQVKRLSKAELEELLRSMRRRASGFAPAKAQHPLAAESRIPSVAKTVSGAPSVAGAVGGAPSVAGAESGASSVAETVGGAASVAETMSGAASVAGAVDGAPSVAETVSGAASVAETVSGAPSVAETVGRAPSVAETVGEAPSVANVDRVIPMAPAPAMGEMEPSDPALLLPETAVLEASPPGDGPGQAGMASENQGRPGVEAFGRTVCRISLEIDAVGEKRIRDLQGMYERLHGEPIGLGQLMTLLAIWAIQRGELPSWQAIAGVNPGVGSSHAPSPRSEAIVQGDASASKKASLVGPTDANARRAAMPQAGALERGGRTASEQTDAVQGNAIEQVEQVEQVERGISTESTPQRSSAPRAEQGELGESIRAVNAKPTELGLAVPTLGLAVPTRKFQPRLLEVVVSIAETGWRFIRTRLGWVPVGDGALAGFLAPGQPVPLENLRMAAVAASKKVSGKRHRPAAVDRYLFARSGGYCEVQGCNRRAVAAHHRRRFAFDPSHHPDALVCVCDTHHGLAHKGLIQDEGRDPSAWELLRVGEEPTLTEPDRKFLAYRGSGDAP